MIERGDQLLTSALTLGEILTKPQAADDVLACQEYEEAIRSTAIIIDFDIAAGRTYAKVRGKGLQKIHPPDAIQLACAATAGVDLFLTNDARLHNVRVDGIHFITSVERAPI